MLSMGVCLCVCLCCGGIGIADDEHGAPDVPTFDFGGNWLDFIKRTQDSDLTRWNSRIMFAQQSLLGSLGVADLKHIHLFIDIGCGSGIHSLAALRAGARSVLSFDLQAGSVNATRLLWKQEGSPDRWTVLQGSVLDAEFMVGLPRADLVYAWGSLHHTGDTRTALANAKQLLKSGGMMHVALYSSEFETEVEFWDGMKRRYVTGTATRERNLMEFAYVYFLVRDSIEERLEGARRQLDVSKLSDPLRYELILKHFTFLDSHELLNRGMDLFASARDFIGGWPMERLEAMHVVELAGDMGLLVQSVNAQMNGGPTEFNLRLPSDGEDLTKNGIGLQLMPFWAEQGLRLVRVDEPFGQVDVEMIPGAPSKCWFFRAPAWASFSSEAPRLRLLEDLIILGLSNGMDHKDGQFCRARGRFTHDPAGIAFMTSDFSDPNDNGRDYHVLVPREWPPMMPP